MTRKDALEEMAREADVVRDAVGRLAEMEKTFDDPMYTCFDFHVKRMKEDVGKLKETLDRYIAVDEGGLCRRSA